MQRGTAFEKMTSGRDDLCDEAMLATLLTAQQSRFPIRAGEFDRW